MVKLIINEIPTEVSNGTTILDAALALGIEIPTLCFLKGFHAASSCMVCAVEEKKSGRFIPSCSALAEEGQVIETENEELLVLRKDAVELLLSEHVGDCVAPCVKACPAKIDIPQMYRLVFENRFSDLEKLLRGIDFSVCDQCGAPCEKVCRRKNIDSAVSIKSLLHFCFGKVNAGYETKYTTPESLSIRFNSSYGKMHENEKSEFLKDSKNHNNRKFDLNQNNLSDNDAMSEAGRCIHCDCRKPVSCKLRVLAEKTGSSQRTFSIGERNLVTKNIIHDSIIFEPQKCIKCGICIQITDKNKEFSFAFTKRGYVVRVQPFISGEFSENVKLLASECVEKCPTGAIAFVKNDIKRS